MEGSIKLYKNGEEQTSFSVTNVQNGFSGNLGKVTKNTNYVLKYQTTITAAQLADNRDARALNAALYGFKKDAKGNWVKDDEGTNVKSGKGSSGSGGSSKRGSSTDKITQSNSRTKAIWQGGNPEVNSTDAKNYKPETVANDESSHPGILYEYDDLPTYAQDVVDNIVKDGRYELYDIYFSPFKKGTIWNDMPELEVVPRKVVTDEAQEASALQSLFGTGGN